MTPPTGATAMEIDTSPRLPETARRSSAPITILLCALAMVAEGFDTYSIGYAAPIIIKEWGSDAGLVGLLFAASVIASALGTMAIGPIADRQGRKPCLLVAMLVFGLATLATAHVTDLTMLAIVRILSSLALGASVPIAVALASESVAPERRGAVAAVMSGSIAVGIVLSGLSAAALVPSHGWPSLMYVGGFFALVLALPVYLFIAEPEPSCATEKASAGSIRALFAPDMRVTTTTLLFVMIAIYAVSFFFNFWMPTLLLKSNPDMQAVALANALAQTMSLPGAFLTGRAMDRIGLKALAATFALAAFVLIAAASFAGSFGTLMIGCCFICLFMNAAFGGAIAAPVHLYPQAIRATALGFTIGVSRLVGGSAGPLVGGWLLAMNLPTGLVAAAFAPALLMAAIALVALGRARA